MNDLQYEKVLKDSNKKEGINVRGFFRVQIVDPETGEVSGDSQWMQNQVTNLGFNQFLVSALGSIAGSKYISHLALGTGGAPAASANTLPRPLPMDATRLR
jgi:hypothetical protein